MPIPTTPAACTHPESERQKLHHHGLPVELCRACEHTRGYRVDSSAWRERGDLGPFPGRWGEWMPRIDGWAAAPLFTVPYFPPGEMFTETAVDQWRRDKGADPITGELA